MSQTSCINLFQQKLQNTATFIKFCSKFQFMPFTWQNNGKCCIILMNNSQLLWWYIISLWVIPFNIFLWIDLFYQHKRYIKEEQLLQLTLHVIYCVGWLIIVCIRLDYFLNRKLKVEAFNKLLEFLRQSIENEPANIKEYTKYWKIFDRIIPFTLLGAFVGAGCFCLGVLIFPEHHNYWWFLLIPMQKFHYSAWVLFCFVEFIQALYAWIAFIGSFYLTIFYVVCLNNVLDAMNKNSTGGQSEFIGAIKFRQVYNKLHLLNTMFNQGYTSLLGFPGLKITCTLYSICAISLLIVIARKINPIATASMVDGSLFAITIVAATLPLAGNIYEKSKELKERFSKSTMNKGSMQVISCCRPLAISVGSLYPIQKITILTYFSLFLANLVNVLIVLQNIKI